MLPAEEQSKTMNTAVRSDPAPRPCMPALPSRVTAHFACVVALCSLTALAPRFAFALEYPYAPYNEGKMDPQKTGWPLSEEEKQYVLKPEYERRPGREITQHKPAMWPVTPSAGHWGGTSWLDMHAKLVKTAQASKGPIDVLLVGDSITMQWGAAWQKHFGQYKSVNIGIGGDKTQNVLWRLDHGGVEGLEPRLVVLLIGNNNMFFTPETGIAPAAEGIKVCVQNLREKFTNAPVVVVKVFPAHAPGNRFYEDIKKVNAALDKLNLEADPKVKVLDLWDEMVNADGTIKKELFTSDNIHLTQNGGYELYAGKLKPVIEALLSGKPVSTSDKSKPTLEATPSQPTTPPPTAGAKATLFADITYTNVINSPQVLRYPYAPYNESKMDPQLTGWPLTDAEKAWVSKEEYTRKPGHEVQKHLPEMWAVTPTASHWKPKTEGDGNLWINHHATILEKVQANKNDIDIAIVGDSITQGWGGGWDGAHFNAVWQKHFGRHKTVNLGIGGDRTENVLWRLDHGALDGASPTVAVLMIGVNNAPLVTANGVSAASVAQGIQLCVQNLRARCPRTEIVLVKIFPAFAPDSVVHADIKLINASLDALKLDADPKLHILDLWSDFTNLDGSLKAAAYSDGHLHLSNTGYEIWAGGLQPLLGKLLTGKNGA